MPPTAKIESCGSNVIVKLPSVEQGKVTSVEVERVVPLVCSERDVVGWIAAAYSQTRIYNSLLFVPVLRYEGNSVAKEQCLERLIINLLFSGLSVLIIGVQDCD